MAADNDILKFAGAAAAGDMIDDGDYASLNVAGHVPGIANNALENKALKQSSLMAAGLAQFLADYQPVDIGDHLVPADISLYNKAAIDAERLEHYTGANQVLALEGSQNFVGGLILKWGSVSKTAAGSFDFSFPDGGFPNNAFHIFPTFTAIDAILTSSALIGSVVSKTTGNIIFSVGAGSNVSSWSASYFAIGI
jgi:hypothetical protein